LIHNPPKGCHRLLFSVEEVLKETATVQWRWIGIALTVLSKFCEPIVRLTCIDDLEEASRVEVGAALVVENSQIIGLNANGRVGLTGGQVRVTGVFPAQFDNHS